MYLLALCCMSESLILERKSVQYGIYSVLETARVEFFTFLWKFGDETPFAPSQNHVLLRCDLQILPRTRARKTSYRFYATVRNKGLKKLKTEDLFEWKNQDEFMYLPSLLWNGPPILFSASLLSLSTHLYWSCKPHLLDWSSSM